MNKNPNEQAESKIKDADSDDDEEIDITKFGSKKAFLEAKAKRKNELQFAVAGAASGKNGMRTSIGDPSSAWNV